jgi:hypothetical protein
LPGIRNVPDSSDWPASGGQGLTNEALVEHIVPPLPLLDDCTNCGRGEEAPLEVDCHESWCLISHSRFQASALVTSCNDFSCMMTSSIKFLQPCGSLVGMADAGTFVSSRNWLFNQLLSQLFYILMSIIRVGQKQLFINFERCFKRSLLQPKFHLTWREDSRCCMIVWFQTRHFAGCNLGLLRRDWPVVTNFESPCQSKLGITILKFTKL